jgi:hypothetical protein
MKGALGAVWQSAALLRARRRWNLTSWQPSLALLARPFWLVIAPLTLALFFVVTGFRGVDLGYHWDEVDWQIQPARKMIESGILLPRSYIYPSFARLLVLLPAVPAGIRAGRHPPADARAVQSAMLTAMEAKDYLLQVRKVFIAVSALAVLWVYAAVLALKRKPWEVWVAAGGLGLSWEYAYHARWVATDCILVQFAALTLLGVALFHGTRKPVWLFAAAVAAGLGTGTKYPGVVLLVPVLLSGVLVRPPRKLRRLALRLALVCGVAFTAYLVTTPATLLDPFAFSEQLHGISAHYAGNDTHGGYSVASRSRHYQLVILYFAVTYFSPFMALALLFFVSTLVGAVAWVRAAPRVGLTLACFPVAFVVFFATNYRVVIVRNYLLIAPFLAVLAARGMAAAFDRISRPWARRCLGGALAAALAVQAVWLARAAESIRHVDPGAEVGDAIAYVSHHPRTRFRLSERIRKVAAQEKLGIPANVLEGHGADSVVFVAPTEGPDPYHWRTNDPWLTEQVFGPREVNFDWYSTWSGHERVVVMKADKARATGVTLAE